MRRILTYIMLVSALSVNALHQVYAATAVDGDAIDIVGRVVDARTEAPVAGTVVRIGEDYLWAVTGENGSFVFRLNTAVSVPPRLRERPLHQVPQF